MGNFLTLIRQRIKNNRRSQKRSYNVENFLLLPVFVFTFLFRCRRLRSVDKPLSENSEHVASRLSGRLQPPDAQSGRD